MPASREAPPPKHVARPYLTDEGPGLTGHNEAMASIGAGCMNADMKRGATDEEVAAFLVA